MPRIVSVWLPRWPILRFLAAQARNTAPAPQVDPERPFILAVDGPGGPRVAALNAAAEAAGVAVGDSLADARARTGGPQVQATDPAADDAALQRLALWATRYTPAVAPFDDANGADGLFLEVAGSAHLFGGEADLLADLARRLTHFGLPARLAVAGTAGAAWALSRCHPAEQVILPTGEEEAGLAALPIGGLRLGADTRRTLRRLGFKRIGALIDQPRAPLAARFEGALLKRLDQALGRLPEPLTFITPPPAYHRLRHLLEPIMSQEAVVAVATRLMQDLVPALEQDGVGARSLRLALYRVDGETTAVDIGLSLPTRAAAHVARLLALKLERLDVASAAGFGFETVSLAVTVPERLAPRQLNLAAGAADDREGCAALVDNLRHRLGATSVRWLAPVSSHLPERAERSRAAGDEAIPWPTPDGARLRPLFLLPRAEPAAVMALVPEGPPRRFRWRGATHDIAHTQGPERIAGEWWRHRRSPPTRDYYLVEDAAGRRLWLYREGLYERETASPRWFVHGLFA